MKTDLLIKTLFVHCDVNSSSSEQRLSPLLDLFFWPLELISQMCEPLFFVPKITENIRGSPVMTVLFTTEEHILVCSCSWQRFPHLCECLCWLRQTLLDQTWAEKHVIIVIIHSKPITWSWLVTVLNFNCTLYPGRYKNQLKAPKAPYTYKEHFFNDSLWHKRAAKGRKCP